MGKDCRIYSCDKVTSKDGLPKGQWSFGRVAQYAWDPATRQCRCLRYEIHRMKVELRAGLFQGKGIYRCAQDRTRSSFNMLEELYRRCVYLHVPLTGDKGWQRRQIFTAE
jgi:hypothetical protein